MSSRSIILCAISSILILISSITWVIYNLYIHPLSRFPGPRSWAVTRLPYTKALWQGRLHIRIKELHDQYGPVVRITPEELSFIEDAAGQDIYTGKIGNKGFPKHKAFNNSQKFISLFDAPDELHTRWRKMFVNRFFSIAAVIKQEEILHYYTDMLIEKLKSKINEHTNANGLQSSTNCASRIVDLQEWYNFVTFDIAGKLTLSEDFGCLEGRAYHPWVSLVLTHLRVSTVVMCLRFYSPLDKLLIRLTPPNFLKLQDKFLKLIGEKIDRRVTAKDLSLEHDDFVSAAMKNSKSDGMSRGDLDANCILMMLAGSETMATSLLSATNLLCNNPRVLRNLTEEIRKIDAESELKLSTLNSLPYLNAVIRETHRLCPPLANGPARVIGGLHDVQIGGYSVPAGTAVGVTQYAAYHSATNFLYPEEFIPERWLKEESATIYANDNRDVVRPFSMGGRDCLGQNIAMAEFRVVLARMIWNFDISPVSKFLWREQRVFMLWEKKKYLVELKIAGT